VTEGDSRVYSKLNQHVQMKVSEKQGS